MNTYIEKLKEYLGEHEPNYGAGNMHSLMEMFYWCYTEANPVSNDKIKGGFRKIDAYLQDLNFREADRVLCAVSELCNEYEYMAFCEGVHVGIRLMMELTQGEKTVLTIQEEK